MKLRQLVLTALAIAVTQPALAGSGFGFLKSACGEGYGPAACSACTPEYVKEKYTKSCYKCEKKAICIPPIKFPWMKCNEFGTPEVRCVTRFKKEEIECERWVVKWNLDEDLAGCGKCGSDGCGCGEGCGPGKCRSGICSRNGGCTPCGE